MAERGLMLEVLVKCSFCAAFKLSAPNRGTIMEQHIRWNVKAPKIVLINQPVHLL
jgi:hypothetical protein